MGKRRRKMAEAKCDPRKSDFTFDNYVYQQITGKKYLMQFG